MSAESIFLIIYECGFILTALAFVIWETAHPSRGWVETYPGGKAYRSRQVWLAGLFFGVVWPVTWVTAFPEIYWEGDYWDIDPVRSAAKGGIHGDSAAVAASCSNS